MKTYSKIKFHFLSQKLDLNFQYCSVDATNLSNSDNNTLRQNKIKLDLGTQAHAGDGRNKFTLDTGVLHK